MLRSSKLSSGAPGTTNTFVFPLRLGSWALTLSKLTRGCQLTGAFEAVFLGRG